MNEKDKERLTNQVTFCAKLSNVGVFRLSQRIGVLVNASDTGGSDRLEDINNFLLLFHVATRPIGLAPADAVHDVWLSWAAEKSAVPGLFRERQRKERNEG